MAKNMRNLAARIVIATAQFAKRQASKRLSDDELRAIGETQAAIIAAKHYKPSK